MINLDLPDFEHDWRLAQAGDNGCWVCPVCLTRRTSQPVGAICLDAVLAWGHRMREAGAEVERSAIVRHLIDRAEDVRDTPACYDFTNQLATEIETGNHNQED